MAYRTTRSGRMVPNTRLLGFFTGGESEGRPGDGGGEKTRWLKWKREEVEESGPRSWLYDAALRRLIRGGEKTTLVCVAPLRSRVGGMLDTRKSAASESVRDGRWRGECGEGKGMRRARLLEGVASHGGIRDPVSSLSPANGEGVVQASRCFQAVSSACGGRSKEKRSSVTLGTQQECQVQGPPPVSEPETSDVMRPGRRQREGKLTAHATEAPSKVESHNGTGSPGGRGPLMGQHVDRGGGKAEWGGLWWPSEGRSCLLYTSPSPRDS